MKKALPLILLLLLAALTLIIRNCNTPAGEKDNPAVADNNPKRGLDRNPSHINYSKHARCRMNCRHIDEAEVRQILKDGKINYTKSELKGAECRKRYAVEGLTRDRQEVRIIFAPCADEITVVTVIDLGKEWTCECP